jgi:hypothetical protein
LGPKASESKRSGRPKPAATMPLESHWKKRGSGARNRPIRVLSAQSLSANLRA